MVLQCVWKHLAALEAPTPAPEQAKAGVSSRKYIIEIRHINILVYSQWQILNP